MTDDRANELTHILVSYANTCARASFSERIEALTEARAQILELFVECGSETA